MKKRVVEDWIGFGFGVVFWAIGFVFLVVVCAEASGVITLEKAPSYSIMDAIMVASLISFALTVGSFIMFKEWNKESLKDQDALGLDNAPPYH